MPFITIDQDINQIENNLKIEITKLQEAIAQRGDVYDLNVSELTIDDSFVNEKMRLVNELMTKNEFENDEILNLIEALLFEAINQDKYNINITETGDNQIVVFTENKNKEFKNLAIDEDCDISYMYFAKNKKDSDRKMYYFEDGINISQLASLL